MNRLLTLALVALPVLTVPASGKALPPEPPDTHSVVSGNRDFAFDLYRQDLYVQLRWPLPATPHDECKEGRRVTTYLLRGSDADTLMFTSAQTAREVTQQGAEAGKGAPKADSASQRDGDQHE